MFFVYRKCKIVFENLIKFEFKCFFVVVGLKRAESALDRAKSDSVRAIIAKHLINVDCYQSQNCSTASAAAINAK